jgi:hypothetical protein
MLRNEISIDLIFSISGPSTKVKDVNNTAAKQPTLL